MTRHFLGLVALLGLALAGTAVSTEETVVHPASPPALQRATEQIRTMFPSASITFAVTFDREPIFAATDTAGVTLLLGRDGPGQILRLDAAGHLEWQHDEPLTYHSPFPPDFTPAAGAVMTSRVVMDEEGPVRHLVLDPKGHVAFEDTLDAWMELSPDGQYYFDGNQTGNEIVLQRLSGGRRRVRIPPPDDPAAAKSETLTVGFASNDRLMISGISAGKRRTGLLDLLSGVALWTELEFPTTARPACVGRFQTGFDRLGRLLYADAQDSSEGAGKVFGFDAEGKLLWESKPIGARVVCSTDQEIAALPSRYEVEIVDTKTGRILDKRDIETCMAWIYDASLENGRLTVASQDFRNDPRLIQASVAPTGKILSLEEHPILVRGLAASALSCVVLPQGSGEGWIVAGFRK